MYLAGKTGPVVFCLHGGGYSGLTWALLAKQLQGRYHCSTYRSSSVSTLWATRHLKHVPGHHISAPNVTCWQSLQPDCATDLLPNLSFCSDANNAAGFPHCLSVPNASHHWGCGYCRARLVAMDQRGHGCTHTDQDEDLSADTLVQVHNDCHSLGISRGDGHPSP